MNPGRFFIPNMPSTGMRFSGIPMMNMKPMTPKSLGIIGKVGNNFKTFNWTNILSGANKTLNVMNQTIPLIRQTRPMFNNMKSMFKLAKAFGNETISKKKNNYQSNSNKIITNNNLKNNKNFNTNYSISNNNENNNGNNNINYIYDDNNKNTNYNYEDSNYPTFFI